MLISLQLLHNRFVACKDQRENVQIQPFFLNTINVRQDRKDNSRTDKTEEVATNGTTYRTQTKEKEENLVKKIINHTEMEHLPDFSYTITYGAEYLKYIIYLHNLKSILFKVSKFSYRAISETYQNTGNSITLSSISCYD